MILACEGQLLTVSLLLLLQLEAALDLQQPVEAAACLAAMGQPLPGVLDMQQLADDLLSSNAASVADESAF